MLFAANLTTRKAIATQFVMQCIAYIFYDIFTMHAFLPEPTNANASNTIRALFFSSNNLGKFPYAALIMSIPISSQKT